MAQVLFQGRFMAIFAMLFGAGIVLMAVPALMDLHSGLTFEELPAQEIRGRLYSWTPSRISVAQETSMYLGTWMEQRKAMIPTTFNFHLIHFPTRVIWFSSGLMLLGMALFKLGVFSARRSKRFYMGMILAALLIGIPRAVYWERFLIRGRPPGTCFSRIMEKHLFSTNLPLVKIRFKKK